MKTVLAKSLMLSGAFGFASLAWGAGDTDYKGEDTGATGVEETPTETTDVAPTDTDSPSVTPEATETPEATATQPEATPETEQMAEQQQQQAQGVGIEFQSGQATLTEEHRQKLSEMMQGQQEIEEVQIAAWADQPLPLEREEVSDQAKQLASQRAQNIQDYLAGLKEGVDVKTFNMAERTNWLASVFNTDEAELKSRFAKRAPEGDDMSSDEISLFQQHGAPSKAVVVVTYQQQQQQQQQEQPGTETTEPMPEQ